MPIDNVLDNPRRVQYVALAAQEDFDYGFAIFAEADLVVEVDSVVQTISTDYTVSGVGEDAGGTVSFVTPMVGDEIVTIYSDTEIARSSDFQQNGPLASSTINDELDKLFVIAQELKAKIGRALRLPFSAEVDSGDIELSPLSSWLGKLLRFRSSDGLPEPVAIADLNGEALSAELIGGVLYPQTQEEEDALVTPSDITVPSHLYGGKIYVKRYYAGDWLTALRAAISVSEQFTYGGLVRLPHGLVEVTSVGSLTGVIQLKARLIIEGEGKYATELKVAAGTADAFGSLFVASSVDKWELHDLTLNGNTSNLVQASSHTLVYISGCSDWAIKNVALKDCGNSPTPGGAHVLVTAVETGGSGPSADFDAEGVPSIGGRIVDCDFDDTGFVQEFGVRLWSEFTSTTLNDGDFTVFVRDTLIERCTFNGFTWNPVEFAGPGVRFNTAAHVRIRNSQTYGGVEADKGASYNKFIDVGVEDVDMVKPDQCGFRCQGYDDGAGGVPTRVAVGNEFIYCYVKGMDGDDTNYPIGFWVNGARDTKIVGFNCDDVTDVSSTSFSPAVRLDDAPGTQILGGHWNNVVGGLWIGPCATSGACNDVSVIGVTADVLYRFYLESGAAIREGLKFVGNTVDVDDQIAFAFTQTGTIALVQGNTLRSQGLGSGVSASAGQIKVVCNSFDNFNIGIDANQSAVVIEDGSNTFDSCNTDISADIAQVLTGAGAVDITRRVTHLITTAADALTLANGREGQRKSVIMKTDGGDGTLTPTNFAGALSTITFDDVGDSAELLFTNGQWHFVGGTATPA